MTLKAPYPNRLFERMRAKGITDPELAQLAGTTKQQIFKLRRGERKLTVEWARRLSPHLGVLWQDLISGAEPSPDDKARIALLAAYEAMTDEQRRALLVIAQGMAPTVPPSEPVAVALARPKGAGPPRPTMGGAVKENRVRRGCAANVRVLRAAE